jgi:light-regulated signal transduction histidine kinase (bacteriophytochrome)
MSSDGSDARADLLDTVANSIGCPDDHYRLPFHGRRGKRARVRVLRRRNARMSGGEQHRIPSLDAERAASGAGEASLAADVERLRTDLAQVGHLASHDLREPLRMVIAYCGLLAESYRGKLDADADEMIDFAIDGAKRMETLLDDLLTYIRLERRAEAHGVVALDALVRSVLASREERIASSVARVELGALPPVSGDARQLGLLLGHLLDNALAFHAEPEPPSIAICARAHGARIEVAVVDAGIGIASRHIDRLFTFGLRLHSRDRYPGNGAGLAICRRIVELHGGRIWMLSEPGRGTEVRFTLPAADAPEPPGAATVGAA